MDAAIAEMKAQGAIVVDPADIPTLGQFDDSELDVLLYEFKADLHTYLDWVGSKAPVHSLADIIAFNDRMHDREMPYFAQELMQRAQAKGPLTDAAYLAALAKDHALARTRGIDAVMDRYSLDALVAPTGGPPWLTDLANGDHADNGSSTPAAVAGYPHVTVPGGYAFGLPVGISFFGRAWSESTLIKLAYAFEQATKHRRPPTLPPTAAFTVRK
jgi:amidase